jgi:hypothetical protein
MKLLVIVVVTLTGGCGSTTDIRQVDPPNRVAGANSANVSQVSVRVEKRQEESEGQSYSPKIEITNLSHSAIRVSRVELMVGEVVYPDSNPNPRSFPFMIQAGKSDSLTAVFPLREEVETTFRKQAQIVVYYRGEDLEQIFRASVGRRFL